MATRADSDLCVGIVAYGSEVMCGAFVVESEQRLHLAASCRPLDSKVHAPGAVVRGQRQRDGFSPAIGVRHLLQMHLTCVATAQPLAWCKCLVRWHLFGACFVIARCMSIWRGVGFGCDPPPIGWFPVTPGSRPYLFGMIVGAPRRGERITTTCAPVACRVLTSAPALAGSQACMIIRIVPRPLPEPPTQRRRAETGG